MQALLIADGGCCLDAFACLRNNHTGGTFSVMTARRYDEDGYAPGDVLPTGEIVVSSTSSMSRGIVFVTRAQAKEARRHGWRIIDGGGDDPSLVRVKRM